jgi:hypothetical protein
MLESIVKGGNQQLALQYARQKRHYSENALSGAFGRAIFFNQ